MGRLCADPELRTTLQGISVASFRLAVERRFADKHTGKRQADYIDIVAWRDNAEFASRYFRKGQLVAVQGSLQTRNYEDKNGNKRTAYEVQADQLHFADGKKDGGHQSPADYYGNQTALPTVPTATASDDDFTPVDDDSSLPF